MYELLIGLGYGFMFAFSGIAFLLSLIGIGQLIGYIQKKSERK